MKRKVSILDGLLGDVSRFRFQLCMLRASIIISQLFLVYTFIEEFTNLIYKLN